MSPLPARLAPLLRVAALLLALGGVVVATAGCASTPAGPPTVVRPAFKAYDRIAILGKLARNDEDYFLPVYMAAFPKQQLVERRDLGAVIVDGDLAPNQLDAGLRANLLKQYGVKAILFPHLEPGHFALKAIDTTTGEITMSILVTPLDEKQPESNKVLIDRAVAELKRQAKR